MKASCLRVLMLLILLEAVAAFAQTDPEGQWDYLYVVCTSQGYPGTGQSEVCFQLRLVTDNSGENRIAALDDALLISGNNLVAADTTWASAFSQSAIAGWFNAYLKKHDNPDPSVAPFHMSYVGFNLSGGLPAGDHLIAEMCFAIEDTGTICIDTLSALNFYNTLVTEQAVEFTAGWGGTAGQGYPEGVGVCCEVPACSAIAGDANADGQTDPG